MVRKCPECGTEVPARICPACGWEKYKKSSGKGKSSSDSGPLLFVVYPINFKR